MGIVRFRTGVVLVCLAALPMSLRAQSFQAVTVNKGPLYGTASVLQDFDGDGDLDIIVTRRFATNEPLPSSVELLENDGTGRFSRQELFAGGLVLPSDIDIGDLDGDGDVDYLVCDNNTSSDPGKLAIFENNGAGAFSPVVLRDSTRYDQAALADLDGDGDLDIVATGFSLSAVSLFVNLGPMSFDLQDIAPGVTQVDLIEPDDIDGDGDTDLVIGGGDLRILFNDGGAGFDSTRILYTASGFSSSRGGLVVTDLDNDGAKDIVTFKRVGLGGLFFLDGADDFGYSAIDVDGIDLGGDLVAFDIDGNGLQDLVRQNTGDDYIAVLYQDAALTFRREMLEVNWDNRNPGPMSVGDLDGDGDPDLVLAENGNIDGDVSWYENIGGTLYRHTIFGEIQAAGSVVARDVDGDGDQDLVVTAGDDSPSRAFQEDEVVWYENLDNTGFREWRIDDDVRFPADLELADLDADQNLEVIVTAHLDSALIVYRNTHPEWERVAVDTSLAGPLAFTVADVNLAGGPDIVLCEGGADRILLFANDGAGNFLRETFSSDVLQPREVEVADFNGDGDPDIVVVAADTGNSVVLFLSDGSGGFDRSTLATGQMGSDIEVGDWDGNAAIDIIVSFDRGQGVGSSRDIVVLANDGNGNFADSDLHQVWERTRRLKLADLDGDGDPDLVLGGKSVTVNDGFQLLVNDGGMVASVVNLSSTAVDIAGIDAADVNGDGSMEIIGTDRDTKSLFYLWGDFSTDVRPEQAGLVPADYTLMPNYPNPFNPSTTLVYALPAAGPVTLEVYNILGERVATLVAAERAAGRHEIQWDASDLPSGTYLLRMKAGGEIRMAKALLLK